MKRLWRTILARTLAVILILTLSLLVFLTSEQGLQFIGKMAKHFLPGTLNYKVLSGHLLRNIEIQDLQYNQGKTHIYISQLSFKWEPLFLFNKNLVINNLNIKNSRIILPQSDISDNKQEKSTPPSKPLSLPNFKWHIQNLNVHEFNFGTNQNPKQVAIRSLHLQSWFNRRHIKLTSTAQLLAPVQYETNIKIDGTPKNYQIDIHNKIYNLDWRLIGHGNLNNIHLMAKTNKGSAGKIDGPIAIGFKPDLTWKANLQLENFSLKEVAPGLEGHINVNVITQKQKHLMEANLLNLNGLIKQQPIRGNIKLNYTNENQFNLKVHLSSNQSLLMAEAREKRNLSAQWNIHIQDLNSFDSNLAGSIATTGKINLDHQSISSEGTLNGNGLKLNLNSIEKLAGQWNVSTNPTYHSTAKFNASSMLVQQHYLNQLKLDLSGSLPHHKLNLQLDSNQADLLLSLTGAYQEKEKSWHGTIRKTDIKVDQLPTWHLKSPTQLTIGKQLKQIGNFCLVNTKNNLCLNANFPTDQPWSVNANSSKLDLNYINSYLPPYYTLSGNTNFAVSATGNKQIQKIEASLHLPAAILKTAGYKQALDLSNTKLLLNYAQEKLSLQLHVPINHQGLIKADIKSASAKNLSGTATIKLPSLQPFQGLLLDTSQLDGKITANYKIGGTLSNPLLNGTFNLEKGTLHYVPFNINVESLELNSTTTNSITKFASTIRSKKKTLTSKGTLSLVNLKPDLAIDIDGKDFPIMNTGKLKLAVSPSLKIIKNNQKFSLSGSLEIDNSNIDISQEASIVSLPSADIEFDNSKQTNTDSLDLETNITLNIGKNVQLKGYGLTGNLNGSLQVFSQPNKPVIANGELTITNGQYNLLGQMLTIEEGALTYANTPISSPNLNVNAYRKIGQLTSGSSLTGDKNFTVGIKLTGPADSLNMDLYSQPIAISQQDILSYLIFGHASNVSTSSFSAALQALSVINSGGDSAGGIVTKAKDFLDVDELDVETSSNVDALGNTTSQQTSFVVGKYLAPDLYLRYSRALDTGYNTIQLQYFIVPQLSIQTETNEQGRGVDLLYTANG